MIDTSHRFQGHGSLRFVYQKGKTVRGPFCSLKYIVNSRRTTYRMAVVVSRKVHKSAVVRNRIRRRLYEIVRQEASRITAPYDIVVIVYSDQLAELPADQLRSLMLEKLEKATILEAESLAAPASHGIVKSSKEN
jgi:ribonuclease P protein component